jgi:hypothetical protein
MSKSTILASGHIHMSDEIVVWLVELVAGRLCCWSGLSSGPCASATTG